MLEVLAWLGLDHEALCHHPLGRGLTTYLSRLELATVRTDPSVLEYMIGSLVRVLAEPLATPSE